MGKQGVWIAGITSGLLLWLAFPPCGWAWLGWLAPLPWLWLAAAPELPGKRPYWAAWGAASLFWLVYLQGVRLAHPALYGGWLALSIYVAAYTPIFLALTRFAVHRWRWPLMIAAPMVWTGLELARGQFLGGFTGGMIGNTQTPYLIVLQAADVAGAYGLSFAMVLVGAALVTAVHAWRKSELPASGGTTGARRLLAIAGPFATAAIVVGLLVAYGTWRLNESTALRQSQDGDRLRIALIQESIDTIFEHNPDRNADGFAKYVSRTEQACAEHAPLDVIVWPESMFTENVLDFLVPDGMRIEQLEPQQRLFDQKVRYVMGRIAQAQGERNEPQPLLVAGTVTVAIDRQGRSREYNSALCIERSGRVLDRYYKRHLVMFGEYIPLGDWFPFVYGLVGMPGALAEGEEDKVFHVAGWRLAPNICFETMVPHRLREQVGELSRRGESPDVLVSLTNDGWFWGSALLDMHLQAAVLRSVEQRRPMVVAANTGLSAWIDGDGRVLAAGPRRSGGTIVAEVRRDGRSTFYSRGGEWPWWGCLSGCGVLLAGVVWDWFRGCRGKRI